MTGMSPSPPVSLSPQAALVRVTLHGASSGELRRQLAWDMLVQRSGLPVGVVVDAVSELVGAGLAYVAGGSLAVVLTWEGREPLDALAAGTPSPRVQA